ncbi:MAG: CarD family transcriptional regulator [Lachnospiraceae bacterium]|nr:CarD family transcriptional regulator [Lachnospiraceae bacterium]
MTNVEVNDAVMHIPEGVCKITGIIERDLASLGIRQYYILVPVYDNGAKIYIPTDGGVSKMKGLLSRDEVWELIDSLPDCESVWIENDKERLAAFTSIVSRCDHHEMMCLIRTLREKHAEKIRIGKKFHSADERISKEAERILFGEIGYVLHLQPSEVASIIAERIDELATA